MQGGAVLGVNPASLGYFGLPIAFCATPPAILGREVCASKSWQPSNENVTVNKVILSAARDEDSDRALPTNLPRSDAYCWRYERYVPSI